MDTNTNHDIKVKRALKLAEIGRYPLSASAMLRAIPHEVIEALTARLLSQMLDSCWSLAEAAKGIAIEEAINSGAIWDDRRQRSIEVRV
jgi:hypothetical protein